MAQKVYKSPEHLIQGELRTEDELYDEASKTPLDDFQEFESSMYLGYDPFHFRQRYGIDDVNYKKTNYPGLLDAYSKSKGKHAGVALTDPEIKKYFDSQMARRQSLYDRFKKIPEEKRKDFAIGLGYELDPFDFEPDAVENSYDPSMDDWFDYNPHDWETIERYLDELGY